MLSIAFSHFNPKVSACAQQSVILLSLSHFLPYEQAKWPVLIIMKPIYSTDSGDISALLIASMFSSIGCFSCVLVHPTRLHVEMQGNQARR